MSKRKCSYSWPHRSRKGMIEYLAEHEGYHPMNSNNGGFVLAWNVKIYRLNSSGKMAPAGYPVCERFDEQWKAYLQENDSLFWECCGDAARYYLEGDWSNYPGIEQGEWKFGMNGRSSGYMILQECPAWCPAPRAWRMFSMIWGSRSDYSEWLADLDFKTLNQFYRAIRVLDTDLTREAAEQEVAYHFSFRRYEWEQELIAQENCAACKMESARPDMYGVAS